MSLLNQYLNMGNNDFECSAVLEGCEIEFTNFCGLDCFGCVRKTSPEFGFLESKTLKKIISFVKEKKYTQIVLSGLGDVFLHEDFYSFIDYIFEEIPDIYIYVMTKGQTLKKSDIEKFLEYKQKGKKIDISFSIFSLDRNTYTKVTGGGNLEHLLDIIKYSYSKRINFSFEFFLDVGNISQIASFEKFSKLFGKDFRYSIPHNWGGKLGGEKYEKIFDENILESIIQKRKKGEICEAFIGDYLFFDYKGDVYKCGLKRYEKGLFLGNIGEKNFSGDIKSLTYDTCKNCSYYSYKTKLG